MSRLGLTVSDSLPSTEDILGGILQSGDLKDAFIGGLKKRKFYHIHNVEYVENEIKLFDRGHDVSKALNVLLRDGVGPFKRNFLKVRISIPKNNTIPNDICVVRHGSSLWLKKITIAMDPNMGESIFLRGVYSHTAVIPDDGTELIQVNSETAKKIRGIGRLPKTTQFVWAKTDPL
jgi:hypothetical protein